MLIPLMFTLSLARGEDVWRVRSEVAVPPHAPVRLRQLLEDSGTLGATGETIVRGGLSPGSSDAVGRQRLTEWLRPIAAEVRRGGRALRLALPIKTIITAGTHEFTAAGVGNELTEAWRAQCAGCQLEIESINMPKVGRVRGWSIKTVPTLPRGPFSVALNIETENAPGTVAWVSGRLLVKRRVPVARRLIPTTDRLGSDDFAFEYRDTAQAIDGIPDAVDLVGRKLTRPLAAGEVIWRAAIERDRAIHQGDVVQLHAGDSGWEVSLGVIAPRDAFTGDVITFKNARTNAVVIGRVTGPGQAEIQ